MSPSLSSYLDLLRLLAALLVFAHHASYPRFDGAWIAPLGGFGHEAVVVFFVLSGFVIAFVRANKENSAPTYAVSRLSRLCSVAWPAILLTLLSDQIGIHLAPTLYEASSQNGLHALASSLFVNEFWIGGFHVGSNIPFWSLSYEAAYYLLFGIFSFATRRWLWLMLAAILIGPKILLLLPAWAVGVLAYRASLRPGSRAGNCWLILLGATFSLVLAAFKLGNLYINWRWTVWFGPDIGAAMGHATAFVSDNLMALGFSAHLVGMARLLRSTSLPPAIGRILSRAALATFPLYLFHYPLLFLFTALSAAALGKPVGLFIGLLTLAVSAAMTPLCEALRLALRARLGLWQRRFSTAGLGDTATLASQARPDSIGAAKPHKL